MFVGHGSPMNAIEKNIFTDTWRSVGDSLPKPRAVLCISAHWLTRGSQITADQKPKTIHDFGGFPEPLYQVQYPAPGSPAIAGEVKNALSAVTTATLTGDWGLDHGTWSILMHMHSAADVPVLQLSIDAGAAPGDFMKIGKALQPLRDKGILIMGSGNIVHNLQLTDWSRLNDYNFVFDWAREADSFVTGCIKSKKWENLTQFGKFSEAMKKAVNSAEHFIPLLYILGAAEAGETPQFFNEMPVGGALTMTSVKLG